MPPPSGGGNGGKIAGIIVAVVVVIGLVIGGIYVFGGDDGGGGVADSGKEYKLTVPGSVTLTDGSYTKNPDSSSQQGGLTTKDRQLFSSIGVSDPKDKNGSYKNGEGLTAKQASFTGVYGKVEDPETAVDGFFTALGKEQKKNGGKAHLEGSAQSQKPAGLSDDTVMKCQYSKNDTGATTPGAPSSVKVPICVWADHSTVGMVLKMDMASMSKGGSISMQEAADTTAKMLKQVRVEK